MDKLCPRPSYGPPVIRAAKCQDDSRILPAYLPCEQDPAVVPIPESCDAFDGSIDVAACRIAKDGRRKERGGPDGRTDGEYQIRSVEGKGEGEGHDRHRRRIW